MARHPVLDGIRKKLRKGKDFQITRSQYIRSTGVDIPQSKSYTEKRSALAKLAEEEGYEIEVVEEIIRFKKMRRGD